MQPIRRIIYFLASLLGKKTPPVFILCYHSFKKNDWRFSVDPEMFENQLKFLVENFDYLGVSDLRSRIQSKSKTKKSAFMVTIDDGYESIEEIMTICNRFQIKPTVFLLADPKNANRSELGTKENFLSKAKIKFLNQKGWTFGSHTMTHGNLINLSENDQVKEIMVSKKKLETDLGIKIKYLAFPKGKYNAISEKLVRQAGYEMAFTMDDAIITSTTDLHHLPRIGVDRSHNFSEFKNLFLINSILIRKLIKIFVSI